jgi:nitroreductase
MDFFDVVNRRRSVRQFTSQPLANDALQRTLEAANQAPSAGNLQAYEIYVVREQKMKEKLAQAAYGQEFLFQAPVVLAFCSHAERARGRYGERGATLYCVQDAAIACTFAMLAATALGLATVWVGAFDEQAVHAILGVPDGIVPLALLPVGYAAEEPQERPRRPLDDVVHER